ncbi:MAG TPA: hypothetical protein VFV41_27940 [Streptosporangiaceae bacterium]|nr:hypothetical protein [Streptosporangiaceae bacterium]
MFWSSRVSAPRRLLIVAAAALIAALAAGCEAGNGAPTLNWHQPTEGAGTEVHGISVRNVFVLGAPLDSTLDAGESTSLFFALVNNNPTPDRLVSIQAPGSASSVTIPAGGIPLGTQQAVLLTGPRPRAVLTNLTRDLTNGGYVTLTMNFQNAGSVTMRVPVVATTDSFGTFSPAPSPTPTTTAKKKHHGANPTVSPAASTTP